MEGSRALGVEVYQAVLDACPSAVFLTDLDSTVVLMNETAARTYGYTVEELVGLRLDDHLVPERMRARRRIWRERYRDLPDGRDMVLEGVESVGLRRDGTEFPAEMHVTGIEVGGEPMVLAYVQDVTLRKQLEIEASGAADDLVAAVSHELRTPLTSVIGYAELLADEIEARVTDPELRAELTRMLGIVERNAARERGLVEDLLTLAFHDADGAGASFGPVDLNLVVRQVVEDHLLRARADGVQLTGVEDPAVGPVWGDATRLHTMVGDLVDNALKFTDAPGEVRVSVHDGGRLASVEVCDSGSGIAAGELPRVFDRLYRSPSAVVAQKPGAGLGLAMVRQVVEAHDGHVSIRSEPGHGTLVQVDLPYAAEVTGTATPPTRPRPQTGTRSTAPTA